MTLLSVRATFTSDPPQPGDDGLHQVPVNADTLPTAEQVHRARWAVERRKRRAEFDRKRRLREATPIPCWPSHDGEEL